MTGQGGGPDAHKVVLKTRRLHGDIRPTANKPCLQWKKLPGKGGYLASVIICSGR